MVLLRKVMCVALVASITTTPHAALSKGKGQEYYKATFFLFGVLMRAGVICHDNLHLKTAMDMVATGDVRDISQGFPDTTKKWAYEGTYYFNDRVMNVGVNQSCAKAMEWRTAVEHELNQTPSNTNRPGEIPTNAPSVVPSRACQLFPNLC